MEKIVNKTCIKNLKKSGAPIIIVAAVKEAEAIAYACKDFGIKVEVLKDILQENKMSFENGNSFWFKSSQEDIAELSKNSSVLINCHAKKKRN